MAPPCSRCLFKAGCEHYRDGASCELAEAHRDALFAEVMALPHITEADRSLVWQYANTMTGLALVDAYLGGVGMFSANAKLGKLDGQPVLHHRASLAGQALRLAQELLITPAARARVAAAMTDRGTVDLAGVLADLARERKGQPVDVEFVAADGDD